MISHRQLSKWDYGEMPVTVNDIIAIMENIAPSSLAESWDNVGFRWETVAGMLTEFVSHWTRFLMLWNKRAMITLTF
jgi:hypothetical protein